MAVINGGTMIGSGASGALVDGTGYRMMFAVDAALNVFWFSPDSRGFRPTVIADAIPTAAR